VRERERVELVAHAAGRERFGERRRHVDLTRRVVALELDLHLVAVADSRGVADLPVEAEVRLPAVDGDARAERRPVHGPAHGRPRLAERVAHVERHLEQVAAAIALPEHRAKPLHRHGGIIARDAPS
jgi:hypothetical protein